MGAFANAFSAPPSTSTYDLRMTDYKQTLKTTDPSGKLEPRQYARLPPILVQAKKGFRVLTQAGYAVGWDVRIAPPAPLYPNLVADRDVQVEAMESPEHKTTWSYTMVIDDTAVIDYAAGEAWPNAIGVLP